MDVVINIVHREPDWLIGLIVASATLLLYALILVVVERRSGPR